MKRKIIITGSILITILVILIGVKLTSNLSHADNNTSNLLYNVIKDEAESGSGYAAKYTGQHNDTLDNSGTEDIYYYKGKTTSTAYGNTLKDKWNVKFAGKCWQMIRTTDTGGVKLIYNGEYTEANKCNNTGTDTQIGTSTFSINSNAYKSPAYVGYMYNPDTLIEHKASSAPTSGSLMGNDVTYSNGTYTLTNTSTTKDDTHHYTCNNIAGTCTTVRYYYYINTFGSSHYYVELTGGKTIEDAVNDMLYADNVNKNNSGIKTVIDTWYQNNMTSYTSYLEDVIYCNDRSQSNASTNGWNKNGSLTATMQFKHSSLNNDLYCTNITDQFTMTNSKAKLTYPVGLMTFPEMNMISNSTARTTGQYYWLSSPDYFYDANLAEERLVGSTGNMGYGSVNNAYGVRPAVSLKPGTTYTDGTGTMDDPYIIDTRTKYDITTSATNGTITSSSIVSETESITIEYAPNAGYKLKSVTVDNNPVDISLYPSSYTFSNVTGNHTISVEFEEETYNLNIEKNTDVDTDETFEFRVRLTKNGKPLDVFTGYVIQSLNVSWQSNYPNIKNYGMVGGIEEFNEIIPDVYEAFDDWQGDANSVEAAIRGHFTEQISENDINPSYLKWAQNLYQTENSSIVDYKFYETDIGVFSKEYESGIDYFKPIGCEISYVYGNENFTHNLVVILGVEYVEKPSSSSEYTYSFQLKSNRGTTFPDLTYGTEYEVWEIDENGNRVNVDESINDKWFLKSSSNNSGVIGDTVHVNFINNITKHHIQAQAINGYISYVNEVNHGDDVTINYRARNGYYLKNILIDDESIDLSGHKTSYTFENVTSDHSIKVIYEVIPGLPLTGGNGIYQYLLIGFIITLVGIIGVIKTKKKRSIV